MEKRTSSKIGYLLDKGTFPSGPFEKFKKKEWGSVEDIEKTLDEFENIVINDKESVFGKLKVLHLLDLIRQDLDLETKNNRG